MKKNTPPSRLGMGKGYLHYIAGRLSSNQLEHIKTTSGKSPFIHLRDLLEKEMAQ